MQRKVNVIFLLLLSSFLGVNAQQDSREEDMQSVSTTPWFVERFKVTGGFFVPVSNTVMQVGVTGDVAGSEIDLEKDLGYNDYQTTFLANAQWRVSRRSRLNFYYYKIPRSSDKTLDKELSFGGETYPVNATVHSAFNSTIFQFSYGYAIFENPKFEFGVLLGAHIVGANASMTIKNESGTLSGSTDFGFTAPLPDLGIWGGYALGDRFAVNLDFDYLALSVDNTSGSILAYNLLFIYRIVDKLDLSVGFSGLNFDINVKKESTEGSFQWAYNGPALGLTYSFGKKSW